ncbi:MAG: hypothetical protein HUU41_01440 [Bryobacteraceae bacterium]|nr:hypothetical protein [Bryobacterales bacterium]MEB2359788.1 hypothetical protein [Bryobacterales bacterium]NUM99753.1 hypothetical protein [Bryobacteraceae bacterium]
MRSLKAFTLASCLGLLTLLVPTANADTWNKKTILTVNEAISVPAPHQKAGMILKPGKYVIKLADSPSNRHIVQIFNEGENHLITTILAIPNYRLEPTGDSKFTFWETPAGQPKALRAWFYPGDNFGQEFVYSPAQATEIAKASGEQVPMTEAGQESFSKAEVASVDKTGTKRELDRKTYQPEQKTAQLQQPKPEVREQPQAAQPQQELYAQNRMPVEQSAHRELPATASPMPLFGLIGLGGLSGAFLVRSIANRLK